jgi:hypothetical protein
MLNLFIDTNAWPTARSRITTLQFDFRHLLSGPCDLCGPNVLANFLGIVPGGAFRWLGSHGIKIAIGAGAVKAWDCGADVGGAWTVEAIHNVEANGGRVAAIALDEPFTSGLPGCAYTIQRTAEVVKTYIDRVKAADPSVEIGLIEPYPFFRIAQLESILNAVSDAGIGLPFFQLDFDPSIRGFDFPSDLKEIQRFCRQRNLPFGVIMIGADGNSSAAAVNGAVSMASMLSSMIGIRSQDYLLFESWLDVPAARAQLDLRFYPDNLPETNPATMTGLLNFVIDTLP